MSTKIHPLKMSTRIHCPREFSIPLPWQGKLSFLLSCFNLSSEQKIWQCFASLYKIDIDQTTHEGKFWSLISTIQTVFNQSWSSIWKSNLRWNLTSMFHLSFRPCCQTREIFAILNEIVHEFEWSKGQKVSKTNCLYLTSFKKLTKNILPY